MGLLNFCFPLQILLFGFKSSRKFSKRLFLWDVVERVCEHMSASEVPAPLVSTSPQPGLSERQLLWNTVSRINSNYVLIGKNEKVRKGGRGGGRTNTCPTMSYLVCLYMYACI